ncbi:helix-turn-helix domain-containing protein [Streptomyces sp. NPDC001948]
MPADSPREVGERIATRRRARRLTQTGLATASHVSYATIRSVERGARRPSDDALEAIAAALPRTALASCVPPVHRRCLWVRSPSRKTSGPSFVAPAAPRGSGRLSWTSFRSA